MVATSLRRIEIKHLWAITVVVGVFVFLNTHPIRPNDFWWHMAIGREILSSGEIPLVDEYSYTMLNQPYPSYQMFWLPEIGMYSLFRLGGPELVILISSLILTLTYALLILICYKESNSLRVASAAVLYAIGLGINNLNIRPQIISYLMGVLFLSGIYGYRKKSHWAWLAIFPLSMLVWVNSHGSFPIGFILLGIWFADEAWQWLTPIIRKKPRLSAKGLIAPGVAILLTAVASLVNPRGIGIISYVTTLTSNQVVQNLVIEWAPPTLNNQVGVIFILGFLIGTTTLIFSPKRPNFFQFLTYLIFSILAFKTIRGVIWFGFVIAPVLADHFVFIASQISWERKRATRKSVSSRLNLIILAVLLLIAFISVPWLKRTLPITGEKSAIISTETPVEATQFLLSEKPPGKLFHEMGFGSYLIWATQPDYKVFVDPRIELYPREIWEEYIIIINALPGWEDYLDRYGVGVLMLNRNNQPDLIQAVEGAESWKKIYQDDTAVIFEREGDI